MVLFDFLLYFYIFSSSFYCLLLHFLIYNSLHLKPMFILSLLTFFRFPLCSIALFTHGFSCYIIFLHCLHSFTLSPTPLHRLPSVLCFDSTLPLLVHYIDHFFPEFQLISNSLSVCSGEVAVFCIDICYDSMCLYWNY